MRQFKDFVFPVQALTVNPVDNVFALGLPAGADVLEFRGGARYPTYGAGQFLPFGYVLPGTGGAGIMAFIDGDNLKVRITSQVLVPADQVTVRVVFDA